MTYPEAVTYLYDRLPVFHRVGAVAYKPGLGTTEALLAALGDPHRQFRSIHVAGTNGKGSTSHLLASIYQSAGYRVGLYTSPHLKSFTERIRVNGQPMAEAAVAAFVTQFTTDHHALIDERQPSFFEMTVAMAFDQFARQQVDVAVVEVGLGGRLDSTNVITPELSVITNIGLDHTDVLGDTLAQIAREKAGIIKPGVPVVVGERLPDTQPVFDELASVQQAPLTYAQLGGWHCTDEGLGVGFRHVTAINQLTGQRLALELPLLGRYQLVNLSTVLTALGLAAPIWPVTTEAIVVGCRDVVRLTGLRGRFQPIPIPASVTANPPLVIADTAHNQPGLQALFETIQTMTYQYLHVVLGFVREKKAADIWPLLPKTAQYYVCQADSPRAMPAVEVAQLAQASGYACRVYTDVNAALAGALAAAQSTDLVVVTGSTYIVAELAYLV